MSYIIPTRDIGEEALKRHRALAQGAAYHRGQLLALWRNAEDMVATDLEPEDMGLIDWKTPSLVPRVYTQWIHHEVDHANLIALYGVLQLSEKPTVTSLRIRVGCKGSATLGVYELEKCYAGLPIIKNLKKVLSASPEIREALGILADKGTLHRFINPALGFPMEGYFSQPIVFSPSQFMYIEVRSRGKSPGDHLILLGNKFSLQGVLIC